jgi:hypothetical protein
MGLLDCNWDLIVLKQLHYKFLDFAGPTTFHLLLNKLEKHRHFRKSVIELCLVHHHLDRKLEMLGYHIQDSQDKEHLVKHNRERRKHLLLGRKLLRKLKHLQLLVFELDILMFFLHVTYMEFLQHKVSFLQQLQLLLLRA